MNAPRGTLLVVVVALAGALAGGACTPSSGSAAATPTVVDEGAVRAMLAAQAADWTRGDLEGFVKVYAHDALFVTKDGFTVGRDEIMARYHRRYRAEGKEMGALALDVEAVRVTGAVARAALRWTLTFARGETATGTSLVVVEARPDGLVIVEDASM